MKQDKKINKLPGLAALRNSAATFKKEEDGVSSVSAVIWVPFFVALIALAVDASLLLMHRGDMWLTSAEVARQLAIGSITEADAQAFVDTYSVRGAGYTVAVDTSADAVAAALTIPITEVSVSSWFVNSTGSISVQATQKLDL